MEDKELKDLLTRATDGPSYGFATKTMRKIEAIEAKKVVFSPKGYNSLVAYVIPVLFGVLMLLVFWLLEPSIYSMNIEIPKWKLVDWSGFQVNSLLIASPLIIVAGFWSWIMWEKKMHEH